jgi:hypothetical protein
MRAEEEGRRRKERRTMTRTDVKKVNMQDSLIVSYDI